MDWTNAFSSLGNNLGSIGGDALSWLGKGENLANLGKDIGGFGTLYSAYNADKLGNKQIDLIGQQNKLTLDDYNQKKKDKEKVNNSFASVWG